MTSYVRAPLNFAAHQRATVGDQKISFTSFDHLGWMKCDGRTVSRTTYALLFGVIGEIFGAGDGSTTFNLPDFRGRVPGAAEAGTGLTTRTRGTAVGTETHTLTVPEMPTHNHGDSNGATISGGNHTHTIRTITNEPGGGALDDAGGSGTINVGGDGSHSHTLTAAGGSQPHNNMQPTLFSGSMYIFSGRMYSGLGTYPYSADTDLA